MMADFFQDLLEGWTCDDAVLLAWLFVAVFCLVTVPGFVFILIQEKASRKRKSLEDALRLEMREHGRQRKIALLQEQQASQ